MYDKETLEELELEISSLTEEDLVEWTNERKYFSVFDFNVYQNLTLNSAVYPKAGTGAIEALSYCGLGLGGETGEVLEHLKKIQRDNNGVVSPERREALSKELGDILWYLARVASELGLELNTIALNNIDKLRDRMDRNVIHGDGDNR
jgi:NTP pyrophosphatase (non-canonical NTP hydrolase)